PRGAYCGAIGVMRPDGSATFNVAIRTVTIDAVTRVSTYGAGGDITWDSRAADEYDEASSKAAALTEQLPDFALLETMRLEDGVILRNDRHVGRLRAPAAYWGFDARVVDHADEALERERGAAPPGAWRLRLTAARDGSIDIVRTPLDEPPGSTADSTSDVRRVALARKPVNSRDRLLHHKTTARAMYDARRAEHPAAFDVLLHNEHGCITELTNGNVVAEIDGRLITPPREAGLLAGTFRAELLDAGIVTEQD